MRPPLRLSATHRDLNGARWSWCGWSRCLRARTPPKTVTRHRVQEAASRAVRIGRRDSSACGERRHQLDGYGVVFVAVCHNVRSLRHAEPGVFGRIGVFGGRVLTLVAKARTGWQGERPVSGRCGGGRWAPRRRVSPAVRPAHRVASSYGGGWRGLAQDGPR